MGRERRVLLRSSPVSARKRGREGGKEEGGKERGGREGGSIY